MSICWHDVSIPIHDGTTVWPGDSPVRLTADSRVAEGASCNTSTISLPTHTGTHCDAPWHFEEGGRKLHEIDPAVYFGDATVIHLPEVDRITAADLGTSPLPPRVLFKTRNSDYPVNGPFNTSFVALAQDAAQRLVDDGVRLVGIDYLSIAPYKNSGPTHHTLLRHDVFVVEGLCLRDVPPGVHPFVVLPMPIHGADGAPCRAFVGLPEV